MNQENKYPFAYNKDTNERFNCFAIKDNIDKLRLLSEQNKLVDSENNEFSVACGESNCPHFKHKRDLFDYNSYKIREKPTKEHLQVQEMLQDYFLNNNIEMILEKRFPKISRIADCYFEYEGQKYNIEVQKSRYKSKEYIERTNDYTSIGIKTIWLSLTTINDFISKNFSAGYEPNGKYLLYINIDKPLSINNIYKIIGNRLNNPIKSNFIECLNFEQFIEFISIKDSYIDYYSSSLNNKLQSTFDARKKELEFELQEIEQSNESKINNLQSIFYARKKELDFKLEDINKEIELKINNEVDIINNGKKIAIKNLKKEYSSISTLLEEAKKQKKRIISYNKDHIGIIKLRDDLLLINKLINERYYSQAMSIIQLMLSDIFKEVIQK